VNDSKQRHIAHVRQNFFTLGLCDTKTFYYEKKGDRRGESKPGGRCHENTDPTCVRKKGVLPDTICEQALLPKVSLMKKLEGEHNQISR